ncbi:S-type pyocin family protein [Brevundimonas sp. AAP58]|uniref:hypothetical protein n=1 Tax=Brevundimonas sp. AAP58 TaxID=1523422 RepID=UPI0006B92E94|nr:hypothetical protein [Brevundimonas sp. AAP58]KPF84819.1 S-type pyocin family protein [Brevundimonas sp. AAP58]
MKATWIGATLVAVLGLAACGNGESAVETRDRALTAPVSLMSATVPEVSGEPVAAAAEAPAPLTANRRETVDEKIQRLYERNGADFGARSPEEFLSRITAFTTSPPSGTDRATRPNGDVLLYQASTNTFAVVDREGTPRTMFKPDEGEAYWAEQKAAAPTFGQRRSNG